MNGEWWSALPPLPLPHEMQQWDRQAVELGILPEILMENAAAAAFRQLSALCPRLAEKQVWLLMGSGNNGGDAACLARYLLDAGACPHVFHTRPLEHYRNETAYHLRTALTCGVPFLPVAALTETPLPHPDILVDGLLGTGFSGQLRDDARRLVSFVNELSPRPLILSLDVPSGLDATSGLPCPEAVKADMTVSFARRQARPDAAVGPSLYRGMPCGPHRHACQSPGRRPLLFPPSGRPCPDPVACHDGRELQEHLRAYPRHGRTPRHVRCRTSGRPGGAA